MPLRERNLLDLVRSTLAGALLLIATPAAADPAVLTRQRVVELARTAPAAEIARAEAGVAAAAAGAAGALSLENPLVSGMGGVRFNPDGSRPFSGVATLAWPIDLGGKRDGRLGAARAEQRLATTAAASEQRRVLLAALLQHALVLHDEQQLAVAAARRELSRRFHAAAERRHAAGSVPQLDVALAGMQLGRDTSAEAVARGTRDADRLQLLAQLGLDQDVPVAGSLVPEGDVPTLAALVAAIDRRPEVKAADAAVEAASARASRERAGRWPTISVLAQYERDDRANIGMLGLAVPIPVLNANRIDVATSAAEVQAARARATHSRGLASGMARELYARYLATKQALDSLAPAAALATRAVTLATRGYELGENDLTSVLLVRREAIDAESTLLEAAHAHAVAKLELLIAAGRTPG